MAAAGPLDLVLFDGFGSLGEGWSERDAAMARRLLAAVPAGGAGTLVVAGNAHTPTAVTELGVPLGRTWPGSGPGSGRSGSATAAGRSGISGHAGSGRLRLARTRSRRG